jgi:hypothetical protein
MKICTYLAVVCLAIAHSAFAQDFPCPEAAITESIALSKAMPELAGKSCPPTTKAITKNVSTRYFDYRSSLDNAPMQSPP